MSNVPVSSRNFYLGCAVWSYKGWLGEFYPPKSRPQDFLQLYSQRLTAVEGNTTFYAVPNQSIVARWAAETSPGFKFCPKFPKTITHGGLLEPKIPEALSFIKRIQGLEDRAGIIFAQLPPSYSPQSLKDLQGFLAALPAKEVDLALEVRHPDWFKSPYCEQLRDLLDELGIATVLLDTRPIYNCPDDPQLNSERRKPQVPLQPIVTGKRSLIRFISHPQSQYNEAYLSEWVDRVREWLAEGVQLYFFVHCPQEARSPHTARTFQKLLEQKGVPIPPLPWDNIVPPSQQLSLF
ncbi:DUF72 domain-containing protein [Lusitaniella coriacea LEGE 07157]|uniref:DUF72 domain-containing protein n=1 Tax=Lusitaniella coriacea LEGE 07157 TaxID=945747 RepID=A0A8J7AYI4_9CYAN|nr:DUF72 domain-containing protein [Lusitaniella coriacea]MBE9114929.1 DUF72 domain-containing protein [Lusitaniella coriacea LEGE 07157]